MRTSSLTLGYPSYSEGGSLFPSCTLWTAISPRDATTHQLTELGGMPRKARAFYDQVRILAAAGNGGRGNVSFFRDNRVEMGPPEGGNGGRGADVIVRACGQMSDMRMAARNFRAEHGANGGVAQCHGRNGKPLRLRVPCGTVVHLLGVSTSTQTSRMQPADSEKRLLAELMADGDEVITARGGSGGRGNMMLKNDAKMSGGASSMLCCTCYACCTCCT